MPRAKHKTKQKDNRDFAEIAFDVFRKATSDSGSTRKTETVKNPAAVELGRKGGHARARKLSAARLKQIAKSAALKRWRKHT
jgi:hypothetical protein